MQIGVETSKAVDQRRVFIIDEDDITRTALQFMLADEIEAHEMASPEEAREKGKGWLKPDLLLVGAAFLESRGTNLIGEMKSAFDGAQILIVYDHSQEAVALSGLHAGANGALVKPLKLDVVRTKVDTVLGRAGAAPLIQLGGMKRMPNAKDFA